MDLKSYLVYRGHELRYYVVEALKGSRSEFLWLTLFVYALAGILAAYMLVILVASLKRPGDPPPMPEGIELPFVTVLVACRDEEDCIERNVRAVAALDYPRERLQLLYVFDRGRDATPDVLARLKERYPIEVHENRGEPSKAGALNWALDTLVRGDVVAVYDADTMPEPTNARRAVGWLLADPAVALVNGRRRVREPGHDLLSRLVSIEYHALYRIEHYGRPVSGGVALFYGSNGFFRREALEGLGGFDARMLVEDIDCGFRILEAGHRVVYDPHVEETEEAPPTLRAWWRQRMRWARGWIQVCGRHLPAAFKHLSGRQRASATLMLVLVPSPLVLVPVLALLVPFLAIPQFRQEFFRPAFWLVVWTLPIMYFMTSWFHDARHGERRWVDLPFIVAVVPMVAYFTLRSVVMWKAFWDHFRGKRAQWTKTARRPSASRAAHGTQGDGGEEDRGESGSAERGHRPLPR